MGRLRPPRERSERALIAGAQAGTEADLEALFRAYWPLAYRTAFLIAHDHAAAEDIAQDAFLAAVRALDRFDRRRRFAPWLARIVANRAIDWTRARSVRREHQDPWDTGSPPSADALSQGFDDELFNALAALPAERRAVVVLRYLLDLTPKEIARALNLPPGTVNSRLRRGLDDLEATLGGARE